MCTIVPGGEKEVAFSTSSASRWMTSATPWPVTPTSSIGSSSMRV